MTETHKNASMSSPDQQPPDASTLHQE
jgi:hypothetical protein